MTDNACGMLDHFLQACYTSHTSSSLRQAVLTTKANLPRFSSLNLVTAQLPFL